MAQWVRAFTWHAEGWVFEYQSRQTYVVKTGSDRSIAKRSALGLSVTGTRRWPLQTDAPCHSGFGTLKNLHCSMVMSAEHSFWSKCAALHRQWWRLHMSRVGRKTIKKSLKSILNAWVKCIIHFINNDNWLEFMINATITESWESNHNSLGWVTTWNRKHLKHFW